MENDTSGTTPECSPGPSLSGDIDEKIRLLIEDSNKNFPLTEVNAKRILTVLCPPGMEPHPKGPGGQGADVEFRNPMNNAVVDRVEIKCTATFRGFDKGLSQAVQRQAEGCKVVIQVPSGTDAQSWMRRFWGNRKKLLESENEIDKAKLEQYRNTNVVIVDPDGNSLLGPEPIFNLLGGK